MPETQITTRYYPSLASVITPEELPEILGFLKVAISGLLSNIHYKDLQYSKSVYGDKAFYSLRIVSKKRIDLEIPGTGIFIVLNPDVEDGNISSFPITVEYDWPILAYTRLFNIDNFSFAPKDFYLLALQILNLSEAQVVANAINILVEPTNGNTGVEQVIVDLQISVSNPSSNPISEIITAIQTQLNTQPSLAIFTTYILSDTPDNTLKKLNTFFRSLLPTNNIKEYIQSLIFPKFSATLALSAGIDFPRKILQPVAPDTLQVIPVEDEKTGHPRAGFRFGEALFYASTEDGVGYSLDIALSTTSPVMIGNTGLIIDIERLKVDLSETENILEADLDGRPASFQGVYAQKVAVTLPPRWFNKEDTHAETTAQIAGYDILIGNGGLSGTLVLELINIGGTEEPKLVKKIGGNGFTIWFNAFDISFKQNKVIESSIQGGLKIPRLKDANGDDAEIDIFGHFDDSGDFLVSASEKDGLKPFGIENVIQFYLKSVELGKEGDDFFIGCACDIEFPSELMKSLVGGQRIQIQRMRFYSDGSFEIIGGTIPVPASFTINLGPVEVNVTNINLSSYQEDGRKYMAFGFDGAIDLGNLGFEARGKGMQFYFTVDDGPFKSAFRIQTIEADLIIPGDASPSTATAIIKGYLSIPQPGESPEYSGGISVSLPKAKIAGGAEIRLQPKYPAFIIDANIQLPVAIPIVPPVSISGFRGLLGFRYVAEKEAVGLKSGPGGDTWYDYYTYPKRGVNIQKFNGPDKSERAKSGFSIGAGATLVTSDGTLLSARVMFILSIPSLFVFDGRANILGTALQLDDPDDPPFYAFIAIGDGSLELGAGLDFKQPKSSGQLITMNVGMEAYFPFRNSRAWYIHLGTRAKPNEARVFDLVSLKSYLELSAKGMALGARGDFNFNKKFGPARVKAWAYIEVGGEVSFERPQIGGYVAAGGGAEVKFWILTVGISIDTIFGAEVPKPFRVYASARVCGKIKIAFVKIKKCITVDIKWEKSKTIDRTPIAPLPEYIANQNVQGLSMLTGKAMSLYRLPDGSGNTTAPNNNFPILPLDTYLDVKFLKPVNPISVKTKIGGVNNRAEGSIETIPPNASAKGRSFRQVEHEYRLETISVQIWNGSSWMNYHPYDALTEKNGVDTSNLKIGTWQKSGLQYDALRILGDNPFSYIQRGEPGWFIPEQIGISSESMFCAHAYEYTKKAHWETTPLGRRYPLIGVNPNADITQAALSNVTKFYSHQGMSFTIIGNDFITGGNRNEADYAVVAKAYAPNFEYSRGLQFNNSNPLVIKYTNPCREVSFSLTTGAKGATFMFYKSVTEEGSSRVTQQLFDQEYRNSAELAAEKYEYISTNLNDTITQIKIVPDVANADSIAAVQETIDQLIEEIYDIEVANVEDETLDAKEAQLTSLFNQLDTLEEEGCQKIEIPCTGISEMEINKDFIVGKGTETVPTKTQTLCETVLFEATWLTEIDHRLELNLPDQVAIASDFKDAQATINNIVAPIWKPDAQYRLHFELTDTVDKTTEKKYSFYYGFATAGPVGHYPGPGVTYQKYKNSNYEFKLDQSEKDVNPHTTLREYIDYKRSYPNADGNLLLSKPLFYGTEGGYNTIQLYFIKAYSYHMFQKWDKYNGTDATDADLEILVKDPVEGVTLSNPPETLEEKTLIPAATLEWTEDNDPLFPKEYRMFNNLAQGDNCMGGDISITQPKRYVSEFTVTNMKPQKLYTTIVNSKYKGPDATEFLSKEVHNFVFQTSRYMTFEEQIKSYELKSSAATELDAPENLAVFSLEINVPKVKLTSAYNIVAGGANNDSNSSELEAEKLDLFDRLMDGLFEMPTLDPAVTTEFNFIKNKETGNIVALLIRNPEPFNDPKIPLDIINGTDKGLLGVAVMSGDIVDDDYQILYAKDYSQLLVMYQMNNETAITAETLSFRFNYLQWNGSIYTKRSSVDVSNILTTTKG